MGYNLEIGEATPLISLEDRYARITVEGKVLDNAPLNSSDNHSNCCYPSYSTWADFTRTVGLEAVFYGDSRDNKWTWTDDEGIKHDPLLNQHPGCRELKEAHYRAFAKARNEYIKLANAELYNIRRLDWLVFWTRWALDNCKYPSFANS